MKKIIAQTVLYLLVVYSSNAQWNGTDPVTTNSNVGIGVGAPDEKLSISSSWGIQGSNTCTYTGTTALKILWAGPSTSYVCNTFTNSAPNIVDIGTSSLKHFVIDRGGQTGIGLAVPLAKLHIAGNVLNQFSVDGDLFRILNTRDQTSNNYAALTIGYNVNQTNNPYLIKAVGFKGGTAENKFVVKNNGNTGIGVSDPKTHLCVNGAVLVDAAGEFNGTFSNNGDIKVLKFGGFDHGEGIGSKKAGTTGLHGLDFYTGYQNRMSLTNAGELRIGNVSIPAGNPNGYKLLVEGGILTEQVKVALKTTNEWSDYVFDPEYHLKPLTEVEDYIHKHQHLPDVPSAEEVVACGINLGKMDATLLQKIEELTLYAIELQKQVAELQNKLGNLENKK